MANKKPSKTTGTPQQSNLTPAGHQPAGGYGSQLDSVLNSLYSQMGMGGGYQPALSAYNQLADGQHVGVNGPGQPGLIAGSGSVAQYPMSRPPASNLQIGGKPTWGGSGQQAGGNGQQQIGGKPYAAMPGGEYSDAIGALMQSMMNPAQNDYQSMAHSMYSSYYDQQRLAAQQAHDNNVLALQQQIDSLGRNYDRQRQESANQYAQAVSQADRRATSRGMGRSSYNMQTLANLQQAGAEAQNQLDQYQTEDANKIQAQIALQAQQLGQQMQQYASGQASDELSWIQQQQLNDQKQQNANDQFLLQFLGTQNQNAIQNQQWQQSFDAQQAQNAVQNQQWQQTFDANQAQNAVQNQQWQQSFNAQQAQNAVQNQQWQQTFNAGQNQQAITNAQWLASFLNGNNQWQQSFDAQNSQWQQTFNAQYPNAGNSSPSGGSSPSTPSTPTTPTTPTTSSTFDWNSFYNSLNTSSNNSSAPHYVPGAAPASQPHALLRSRRR